MAKVEMEDHPTGWYYEPGVMKTLILGSFPPPPHKHIVKFYYPNPKNLFWKVLRAIEKPGNDNDTVEDRKRTMEVLNVGVENMGKKY